MEARSKTSPKRQKIFAIATSHHHHLSMSLDAYPSQPPGTASSEAALASVSNFKASFRQTSCQQYVNMEYVLLLEFREKNKTTTNSYSSGYIARIGDMFGLL